MTRNLCEDLLAIWQAGVDGVDVRRLVGEAMAIERDGLVPPAQQLVIGDAFYPLADIKRISVIGAGKATAGMAAAVELVLAEQIDAGIVAGWVNIPDGCQACLAGPLCCLAGVPAVRSASDAASLRVIRQHVARPAGVNEPTEAGVFGTQQMLALIDATNRELSQQGIPLAQHLVLCLMSGGGSALMPLPAPGVTLEQKLAVTRFLSASGATINEINTVRKQLSGVKGGGLKEFCRGTKLVGLILSDVLGDPLDIIASGPTVDNETTAPDAVHVLDKYGFAHSAQYAELARNILDRLQETAAGNAVSETNGVTGSGGSVRNLVIGNNATAVDAAGLEAVKRGYSPTMLCATQSEGDVETLADHFVDLIQSTTRKLVAHLALAYASCSESPRRNARQGFRRRLPIALHTTLWANSRV